MDPKKLIVGFLILAAGTSSAAFILSGITANRLPAAGGETAIQNQTPAQTPTDNAFADNTADPAGQAIASQTISTTTEALIADPDNLTSNLADLFLNNMVAQNPDGGITDENGNASVAPPDSQSIMQELTQTKAAADIQIPNWDIEAVERPAKTISNYSDTDIQNYGTALQNIFTKDIESQGVLSDLQQNDAAQASNIQLNLEKALDDVASLQTPASLVDFQKSLIKLLVYEKNYAVLAANASADPIKTSLIASAEQAKFDTAAQELQNQIEKLANKPVSEKNAAPEQPAFLALINNLFGIPAARAQFVPVHDILNQAAIHANTVVVPLKTYLLHYLENVALQIARNMLMAIVQQKILVWIQGSGAPRFITNWGSTIVNSYAAAAQAAIDSQFACMPSFMLPSLKILLSTPAVAGGNNACQAQFNSQLSNNLQNFYNHFENGGLDSYFSLFQTNGNFFGAIISIQDAAMTAGATAQQATLAKTTSAQGYNGSDACDDQNPLIYVQGKYLPDGSHYACQDNADGHKYYARVGSGGSIACDGGQSLVQVPNGNLCANGDTPQVTTPGNVANQAMGSAIDAPTKLIAGSVEISGLAAAVLQSVLNTLAQSAINYSNQTFQSVLQSGGNGLSDQGVVGTPSSTGASVIQQGTNYLSANGANGVNCTADNPDPIMDSSGQPITVGFVASGGATDQNGIPPTYTWSSSSGGTGTGDSYNEIYTAPGTYTVTVTASNDNSQSTCTVTVTSGNASSNTTCGVPPTSPGSCPGSESCVPSTNNGVTTFSCQ